jgi:predicted GNAT family N-acyltransferase
MMDLVELGALTEQDWADLAAGEHEPFGPIGAGLAWRAKDRHVGLRAGDGHLVAVAGAVIATVEIERSASFEVVGLGSLIVNRSVRGHGLMSRLVEPVLRLAESMGPSRAMIFCRPELVALYRRLGFAEITAPVWADQPEGRVEMPEPAMWRPLREVDGWPPGRVDVRGLPF